MRLRREETRGELWRKVERGGGGGGAGGTDDRKRGGGFQLVRL